MTLRIKTLFVMTLTLAALILLLLLVLRNITIDSYAALETNVVLRNLNRATNNLQDAISAMQRGVQDWTSWDDAYQFVQDGNAAFVDTYLTDDALQILDINVMLFVNAAGEIVQITAVDHDKAWQQNIPQQLTNYTNDRHAFVPLMSTGAAGYIVIGGEPLLVAAYPILPSDESSPPAGTLIWLRRLQGAQIEHIAQSLSLSLEVRRVDQPDLPGDYRGALARLTSANRQFATPIDNTQVGAYGIIDDVYGDPNLIVRVAQQRDIYQQGQQSLTYFIGMLAIVGIVFSAAALLLLERLVLAPLAHLSERVRKIGSDANFTPRLPVTGNDELAQLAGSINTMLSAVDQSRAQLQQLNSELESRVAERTCELENQKAQLQVIMDTMGEGLVFFEDRRAAYVNPAFAALLGFPINELAGKSFDELKAEFDPLDTPAAQNQLQQYQTELLRRDGSPVSVAVTSTPIVAGDGVRRRVVIVRDITQELAAQAEKDYFFARASHELRTPLTNLITRLYLLGKNPESAADHLKILQRVSSQMMALVNDLLDISRFEQRAVALRRTELVLQDIAEEVVEEQLADAALKQLSLRLEVTDEPLRVLADRTRLRQVMTNLISNAIRYTPEDGEVIVRVEERCYDAYNCGIIHVIDNGDGISPDNLERIFDPFFRVNDEQSTGTGLGLYIVKEIVELHGGEINVSSEVGKGTTFTVRLALALAQDTATVGG